MSIPLYTDQHVHDGIVDALRIRGVDVLMAREDGTATVPDVELLARASELGRPLFTNDTDFLEIGANLQRAGREFCGVLFAPQQGTPIGQLINDLELISKAMVLSEVCNTVTYLPL